MNMSYLTKWSKLSELERYDGCVFCFGIANAIFLFGFVLCMLMRIVLGCQGFSNQPYFSSGLKHYRFQTTCTRKFRAISFSPAIMAEFDLISFNVKGLRDDKQKQKKSKKKAYDKKQDSLFSRNVFLSGI